MIEICTKNGHRYKVGGPQRDAVSMEVELSKLDRHITVDDVLLVRRTSFHVTLVAAGHIARRHGLRTAEFVPELLEQFRLYVEETPITFFRFRDEFRLVREADCQSVVIMCDVVNLGAFFARVGEHYGIRFEYPPTHVTLYTRRQDEGIFLTCQEELDRLSVSIPAPCGLPTPWA